MKQEERKTFDGLRRDIGQRKEREHRVNVRRAQSGGALLGWDFFTVSLEQDLPSGGTKPALAYVVGNEQGDREFIFYPQIDKWFPINRYAPQATE